VVANRRDRRAIGDCQVVTVNNAWCHLRPSIFMRTLKVKPVERQRVQMPGERRPVAVSITNSGLHRSKADGT
jgi:hypothetical protein